MKLFIFFIIRGIFVFLFSFIIFSLVRTKFFKEYKRKSNPKRELNLSLFVAYISVICVFLFTPNILLSNRGIDLTSANFDFVGDFKDRIEQGSWGVNLIPFRTIVNYIKYSNAFSSFINIFGNVLIFLPFGYLVPLLYKEFKKLKNLIYLSIIFSFSIEVVQFFVGRSVDIDDLLLNTLGAILGFLIYKRKVN